MLKLREFSHNHHPGRVKMLAEHIRRGISVINQYTDKVDSRLQVGIRKPGKNKSFPGFSNSGNFLNTYLSMLRDILPRSISTLRMETSMISPTCRLTPGGT